jgi:hypothetical protein
MRTETRNRLRRAGLTDEQIEHEDDRYTRMSREARERHDTHVDSVTDADLAREFAEREARHDHEVPDDEETPNG